MIRPFQIQVPDEVLADLNERLDRTLWPPAPAGLGWSRGADVAFVRRVCDHWRHRYDWRAHEARLNQLPHHLVELSVAHPTSQTIHAIHVAGVGTDPMPLVLTHGWPSTFHEMVDVIGPLTDPAAHGGDPADAFHLVVPSLPGYGFSPAPTTTGTSTDHIADLWVELMAAFGYDRFAAHGGDWGSAVTTGLARRHPDRMIGIHLNMVAPPIDPTTLTDDQREWWDDLAAYRDAEWGYVHLQRTKPQTAAFALTDSPAGLAAWITEKWWRWTDCARPDGERHLEDRVSLDHLCTTLTIYWATRTIGPSMHLYAETFGPGNTIPQGRIDVPTGVSLFNEKNRAPRELVEPHFDLRHYATIDDGGHFPATENPAGLVAEIRDVFRPLRPRPPTTRPAV